LRKVLDPSWGIAGVRAENDTNRALKLGRAGVVQSISGSIDSIIPPIQIEPGEMIADVLILYAKRERKLVNVSSDGYLQFWAPKKTDQPLYKFDLHPSDDARHTSNNIERVTLSEAIDGLFTEVICVGTVVRPPENGDPRDPNEGHFRGTYRAPATLPFVHRFTFADGDQLVKAMANDRARWKAERGLFDSWQYVIQVKGHSQNGVFYEPDNFAEVDDAVNGVQGVLYVSAVRYARDLRSGQTTTLTLRKPGLLGA
jgi:prophage tail gpP-like protein